MTAQSRQEIGQAQVQYSIGLGYFARGESSLAPEQWRRALERDPTHAASALAASRLHLKLGQDIATLELAEAVLRREPRNPTALFLAGMAAARLQRPEEALGRLELAAAGDPDNAEFSGAFAEPRGSPAP